jgi:hypothetical protein
MIPPQGRTTIMTTTKVITMTTVSIALMLALSTSSVYAAQDNAYHHEAEIGFLDSDDGGDGIFNANYRYYFNAVEQADKPYALADFFHQGSKVAVRYSTSDFDDIYALSGQYVFDSNWFINAEVSQVDFEEYEYSTTLDSFTIYAVNLGYFFTDHSALTLGYSTMSESKATSFTSASYNSERYYSNDFDAFRLTYEHFIPLQSTVGVMLTGTLAYSDEQYSNHFLNSDTNDQGQVTNSNSGQNITYDRYNVAINADWYINNSWSVGAVIEQGNTDTHYNFSSANYDDVGSIDQTDTSTSINTRYTWRFADIFSAKFSLSYSNFDGEYENDSQTNFSVGVNARF